MAGKVIKKFDTILDALSYVQSLEERVNTVELTYEWSTHNYHTRIIYGLNAPCVKKQLADAVPVLARLCALQGTERTIRALTGRNYGVNLYVDDFKLDDLFDLVDDDEYIEISRDHGGKYTAYMRNLFINLD